MPEYVKKKKNVDSNKYTYVWLAEEMIIPV